MRVDAHHHLWDPRQRSYAWMAAENPALDRTFDVADLRAAMVGTPVEMTVVVQTLPDVGETESLLAAAAASDGLIAGVIGWVDLTDPAVGDTLARLMSSDAGYLLVGIRHQAHDEADADWLMRDDVRRGLHAVSDVGLVYDLLVRPRELPAAVAVVGAIPDLSFVLDHIGKPRIAMRELEPWATLVAKLAAHRNVSCKLSGMVTEAALNADAADLAPYADRVIEVFGPERLMFGSDWPVCTSRRSYRGVYDLAVELLGDLTGGERESILGDNAIKTYGLV